MSLNPTADHWQQVAHDEINKRCHLETALRLCIAMHPELGDMPTVRRAADLVGWTRP